MIAAIRTREGAVHHLIAASRAALHAGNYYAALSVALSLPDVASRIDAPAVKSSNKRYPRWVDEFLSPEYGGMLSGKDCYALRCAYLHQGEFDIRDQSARDVLERIHFVLVRPGSRVHRIRSAARLLLQVDLFVEDMCVSADRWLVAAMADPARRLRLSSMANFELVAPGFEFRVGDGDLVAFAITD